MSAVLRCILIALYLVGLLGNVPGRSLAEEPVDFALQVQPLLSDRCFSCHGPHEEARQANLRLDVREEAVGRVIVPGDAESSELMRRVRSTDLDERMPPSTSHKLRLSSREAALLGRWIDEGARYDVHWAFRPPRQPQLPTVHRSDWVRNPIDQFVLARLESAGWQPAVVADRRTLIRRLSLDLLGLPPTPEAVLEFESDSSTRAYDKLVNSLIDSDHFGERMAMYWLDVVRYADTNGIHGDNFRPHSSYRDWVIKAFNDNLPFDEFVRHQLAGDLLKDATFVERIASGFNRLNMTTREGGAQPKEYIAIYQADRVRNTSAIFLGLTMGCAQCHDHKFDPLSMRDFYSLAAFFADIAEVPVGQQNAVVMPRIRHDVEKAALDARLAELEQQYLAESPELVRAQAEWEQSLVELPDVWTVLRPEQLRSERDTRFGTDSDGSVRTALDSNPDRDTFVVESRPTLKRVTALFLETLRDDELPAGGPGRGENGNFVLNEIRLLVDGQPVKIARATADHGQAGFTIQHAIDGEAETGWAILPEVDQTHYAVFELAEPIEEADKKLIEIEMAQTFGVSHTVGRFRWWVTDQPATATAASTLAQTEISKIARQALSARSAAEAKIIDTHFRQVTPLLAETRAALEAAREAQQEIGGPQPIVITQAVEPREVRMLPRGNWLDDSGAVVQPAIPQALGELALAGDRRATRLDLANWLVTADNPLVARVYVNRLWKLVFGEGLVRTLDDFGAQGRVPTHPLLLDWLATELIRSGWDTKHVMRLMVSSATYRQSSQATASGRQQDPENELCARQNRYRLDAEMVRDSALAVSGLLVREIGGPSVKPYQPVGYWAHLNFPQRTWQHNTGANQYRRGLYTYWCRTFLHPAMLAFDASTREECTAARPRSNTPLAALVLLNDPTYVEAARVFADRIQREGGDNVADRIDFAYRHALQRAPRDAEMRIMTRLFAEQLAAYADAPAAARDVQTTGLAPAAAEPILIEQAAWTAVARTLLNLHEMITRN